MTASIGYLVVDREDLVAVLLGRTLQNAVPVKDANTAHRFARKGDTLIAAVESIESGSRCILRPRLLALPNSEAREILAWIATYVDDVAPVTQWCRIIDPEWLPRLSEGKVTPRFNGLEAAWAGAAIGEVLARHWENVAEQPLAWCMASSTFAYARGFALWGDLITPDGILEKIEEARSILGAEPRQQLSGLSDLWRILSTLQDRHSRLSRNLSPQERVISSLCHDIAEFGEPSVSGLRRIEEFCSEFEGISRFQELNAEDRVRFIENLLVRLRNSAQVEKYDRLVINFAVGLVVTFAGGGPRSLGLLNPFVKVAPASAAWCLALAGLHAPISWAAGVEGLGRLVVREMESALYIDTAPAADIAIEELRVAINPRVSYKRLPFKAANPRVVTVDIYPGVTISVNVRSRDRDEHSRSPQMAPEPDQLDSRYEDLLKDLTHLLRKHGGDVTDKPKRRTRSRTPKLL